jgi:hypothetical protein
MRHETLFISVTVIALVLNADSKQRFYRHSLKDFLINPSGIIVLVAGFVLTVRVPCYGLVLTGLMLAVGLVGFMFALRWLWTVVTK